MDCRRSVTSFLGRRMSVFTVRRTIAAASMALVASTLATPASAHELDEDKIAAKICPAGTSTEGSEYGDSADSGDKASVDVYSYVAQVDAEDNPVALCTFAIFSTDEDSTLDGDYALSIGAVAPVAGSIWGNDFVTKPLVTNLVDGASATVTSSGKQETPKSSKEKKAAKVKYAKTTKAAKAKYSKAVKAAKAKYKKAGKTAKAKKALTKKVSAAKKKYSNALAKAKADKKFRTSPTERSYSLNLTVPFID